jgi:hypothetical protein
VSIRSTVLILTQAFDRHCFWHRHGIIPLLRNNYHGGNNVGSIVIETPAFVIWPPTLRQFHKFQDDVTPWFVDCRFGRILIMCVYGTELSDRSRGVMGRKLEGTLWEGEEGVNNFYVPQDGHTVSNGGVYELFKGRGCDWISSCGSYPKEYSWANDYDTRFYFSSF